MPYERRIQFDAFVDNQIIIEEYWDKNFGDRKNEIVFIGQDMDEELYRSILDECLATDEELANADWKEGYEDNWPVEKAYAF
jgi:hypothetical protein